MTTHEGMRIAQDRGFDLIEIVPNATPPVCKLMDIGKYKYELTKKEKIQRKHQQVVIMKEIRLHPNTDVHDFEFKTRHARTFLEDGNKVKVTVVFKGREITYKEHGEEMLKRVAEKVSDVGKIEQEAKLEGKHMIMILTADKSAKKKSTPKTNTEENK
jgi:translation initiation factor IF-3